MAQWLGQFTGHTHATKVADAEESLRRALAAFRAAGKGDRSRKAASVLNLADRLLSARLKLLKARITALEPAAEGQDADGIESLRTRESQTRDEGVGGILIEFEVLDVLS